MAYTAPKRLLALLALLLLASPAAAPQAAASDQPEKRTISLAASGIVKTTPDMVDISTGVSSEGTSARAALDKNTEAMSKVVEALKNEGIEAKDIQTANFSIGPVYEQNTDAKPPVNTYTDTPPATGSWFYRISVRQ